MLIYGPYTAVVAILALSCFAVWFQRLSLRRRIESRVRYGAIGTEMPPAASGLEAGFCTVTGTLVTDSEPIAIDPTEPHGVVCGVVVGHDLSRGAADDLFLEVDGERIPLTGQLELRWGSALSMPGPTLDALPRERRAAIESVLGEELNGAARPVFMALSTGDRVRATGYFTRRALKGPGDYRGSASGWSADGDGDHPPISLLFQGRARVHAPSWKRSLALGFLVGSVGLASLYGLGDHAADTLPDPFVEYGRDASDLDHSAWWQAALSPWHCERARRWAERMAPSPPKRRKSHGGTCGSPRSRPGVRPRS
ncbi:MAG: hypothetical protein AB8I08_21470 [Sandaracinaceae bacterium]